jgi:hypothetical protein
MDTLRLSRRRLLAATAAAGIATRARTAAAQSAWDKQPESRPTSSVVPAPMLSGPHYALGPTVTTYAYMNRYTATSDYGSFVAPGDARLRRLVREIAAIAALKQVESSDAFEKAAINAGKSPFSAAKSLIDDPVATLSAVPEGIGSIFDRVSEQVQRSGRSTYEDDTAKEVLAVSGFKREYAAKLGVDVYSSNAVLQTELNRVAWAAAAGNLTLNALSLATGAVVLQVASNVRLLQQARTLVEATPPAELSRQNREQLRRMQVPGGTINALLQNRALSPRHQTIIVASMTALGGIPGRADFIAYASQADNEEDALLYQQMAELLAGYSSGIAPVRQVRIVDNLPVANAAKGRPVLLLPIDRLLWTAQNAAIIAGLAARLQKPGPAEIWMTGDASPLALAGMRKSGLGLVQQCGKRIPLLD